jgi:hypothetical protein
MAKRLKEHQEVDAGLFALDFERQDFPGFAFGGDFEGPAADFAIGRKPLGSQAGVDNEVEPLPAKRTLNGLRNFHPGLGLGYLTVRQTCISISPAGQFSTQV